MKNIFLDYNSTTPVDKQVIEEMLPYFKGSLLDEPVYDRFIQIKNKMEVR